MCFELNTRVDIFTFLSFVSDCRSLSLWQRSILSTNSSVYTARFYIIHLTYVCHSLNLSAYRLHTIIILPAFLSNWSRQAGCASITDAQHLIDYTQISLPSFATRNVPLHFYLSFLCCFLSRFSFIFFKIFLTCSMFSSGIFYIFFF